MAIEVKKRIKKERVRNFVAKDFDSLRSELLSYARIYFPDKIQDFSEASLGGLFLDLAAMVGDTMSFYLDHQFNELNPLTAIESANVTRHVREAGVKITGASPASVKVRFYIDVPAELDPLDRQYKPKFSALPEIQEGTSMKSNSGITFNLVENVDFANKDKNGKLTSRFTVNTTDGSGNPSSFIVSREGLCISGIEITESFKVGSAHEPFREIVLTNPHITEVMSVIDTSLNTYYEVQALSQDTVFRAVLNLGDDNTLVSKNLEIIPAPYRFVSRFDPRSKITVLRFGSGDSSSFEDDIIPDPSKLALPLYGKKTFARFSIDPGKLLDTRTLGISPKNTTLKVRYRYGGGLDHNVPASSIRFVDDLIMEFKNSPTTADAIQVRQSIDVKNNEPARGGSFAPTLDELRNHVPTARQMQSRIVTKQDMLSRIYTLPSQFGRVYRAGMKQSEINPLATNIYIISRNAEGRLSVSPDALKTNLSNYLNEFRVISDAFDILDAQIINFTVNFGILVAPNTSKPKTVQSVISRISKIMEVKNFQIDQPIVLDDIVNIIINTTGVVSLMNLEVKPIIGSTDGRSYSSSTFNFSNATKDRMIIGPPGSIFELRFPEHDIIGSAK